MKHPITRFVRWLKRTKEKRHNKVRALFYKILLIVVEVYAMAMLAMSYYLAYIGREIVLEELSQTITKVIVYPFIAFTINRTVENFAEHNSSKFHTPLGEKSYDEIQEEMEVEEE
ncbi:MAG: hypothetical protein IKP31_02335 [Lachnospiraceae bacterium]|nr:hypothetical protein [Lachnospiraceae bacterium]MBR4719061.1 hypothetical protein [Lachnospiraceae bacterium]